MAEQTLRQPRPMGHRSGSAMTSENPKAIGIVFRTVAYHPDKGEICAAVLPGPMTPRKPVAFASKDDMPDILMGMGALRRESGDRRWAAGVMMLDNVARESDVNAAMLEPLIEAMSPERAKNSPFGIHPFRGEMEFARHERRKKLLLTDGNLELRVTREHARRADEMGIEPIDAAFRMQMDDAEIGVVDEGVAGLETASVAKGASIWQWRCEVDGQTVILRRPREDLLLALMTISIPQRGRALVLDGNPEDRFDLSVTLWNRGEEIERVQYQLENFGVYDAIFPEKNHQVTAQEQSKTVDRPSHTR